MSLDLERDDESRPSDSGDSSEDMLPALRPIYERVGKSLDEILQMEIELINSCTDLEPNMWIAIYAERFRDIMTDDPTLTNSQVKRMLYYKY